MSNENSNDSTDVNINENTSENTNKNINENTSENITFFLKEKNDKNTNNDEIQQMMEELNQHINASELKHWIINDDIEEELNPFFDGALSLYKEYTIKDLLKICNYYGIEKNMKLLKSKKQQIIHALIYFESLPDNFEIVQKRYRMWACITELLNDSKMKKYIIF